MTDLRFGQHPKRAMPLLSWPTYARVGGSRVAEAFLLFYRGITRVFKRKEVS
jgi:hypothetical protein